MKLFTKSVSKEAFVCSAGMNFCNRPEYANQDNFKYSSKTRCRTAHGDRVINAQQENDHREFIAWCAPYVDPKAAQFKLAVESGNGVYGIVTYKVEDGKLAEWKREM